MIICYLLALVLVLYYLTKCQKIQCLLEKKNFFFLTIFKFNFFIVFLNNVHYEFLGALRHHLISHVGKFSGFY